MLQRMKHLAISHIYSSLLSPAAAPSISQIPAWGTNDMKGQQIAEEHQPRQEETKRNRFCFIILRNLNSPDSTVPSLEKQPIQFGLSESLTFKIFTVSAFRLNLLFYKNVLL